jgi:phosphatidylglycerophosphate synthase
MDERCVESFDKYICYPIAQSIAPFFNYFGITPNMVTIFNIFFRIYIILRIINKDKSLLTLWYIILSHFLDCLDGTIARMYKQYSKFGKNLDHISDKIFWGTIFVLILLTCRSQFSLFFIIYLIFILVIIIVINSRNNKHLENIIDFNAIPLIIFIYYFYRKC